MIVKTLCALPFAMKPSSAVGAFILQCIFFMFLPYVLQIVMGESIMLCIDSMSKVVIYFGVQTILLQMESVRSLLRRLEG